MAERKGKGVANIVLPKIQLNEYTQKLSLPAPSYKYTKEGPSHNPRFRASVLVNGEMYDSKSEFLTSKEAMHDAARVALEDLNAKGTTSVPNSVCETGQWKNVLQQHAQKLKFPLPNYTCEKSGDDHSPTFVSTVEVGGIFCTGGIAKSKKAAEMKAARKAFVAIQDQACDSDLQGISYHRKRENELKEPCEEMPAAKLKLSRTCTESVSSDNINWKDRMPVENQLEIHAQQEDTKWRESEDKIRNGELESML